MQSVFFWNRKLEYYFIDFSRFYFNYFVGHMIILWSVLTVVAFAKWAFT